MSSNYPNFNPASLSDLFSAIQEIVKQYLNDYLFTCTFVEVDSLGENNAFVNVKPVIKNLNTKKEDIPITDDDIIYNVPMMTLFGGKCEISFIPEKGDIGFLIACKQDISVFKKDKKESKIGSLRQFSFSDGVFIPLDFKEKKEGIVIRNEDSVLNILPESITIKTKDMIANVDTATINAQSVNLGGEGGKGVARLGDSVQVVVSSGSSSGTWNGVITSASETTKSV